jgi:predicted  nucleic acid-binding Zn-ribbon protein
VQVVDREILALRNEAAALPAQVQAEERTLLTFHSVVEAEKKRHEEVLRERKQFDLEIEACLDAIRRYRAQQFTVKKNEDYAALGKQIADQEHKKDLLEERALSLIEETERLEALLVRRGAEEKAKREELAGFRARVDRELEGVKRRLAEAEERRAELVRSTASGLVEMYDRIRSGKRDGVAVVEVERDACSGCQARLPPQRINELMRGEQVIRCEGCGRILVWAPGGDHGAETT